MTATPDILIGRCSFWPEARDPEAWFRALETLAQAEANGETHWTGPRALANTTLRGHLSRRAVPGLFGIDPQHAPPLILGVGLLEWDDQRATWKLSAIAKDLLDVWETKDHRAALEQLAVLLLRRSVWLRLMLLKLWSGDWRLEGWDRVKASNGQLRVGRTLNWGEDADSEMWLAGIEESALGAWNGELSNHTPLTVQIHAPKTAKPDDGLSLSPLKSPLYLLDSLGWLDASGRLRLPATLQSNPLLGDLISPTISAATILAESEAAFSDHRGAFPLEPVMLRFAQELGVFSDPSPNDPAFIGWADRLLSESFREGVIELFSAEPGQPRHGRGLLGDPRQKLIRWRVHEGFDALCRRVSSSLPEPETVIFS